MATRGHFVAVGMGILVEGSFAIDLFKSMDRKSKRQRTQLFFYVALCTLTFSLWLYVMLTTPDI